MRDKFDYIKKFLKNLAKRNASYNVKSQTTNQEENICSTHDS